MGANFVNTLEIATSNFFLDSKIRKLMCISTWVHCMHTYVHVCNHNMYAQPIIDHFSVQF